MKFEDLLRITSDLPLFESSLLLAGDIQPAELARQLSRWQRAGRIIQLRRGLYTLAPPLRKVVPHPFLIANYMAPGSYVSGHSALSHFGIIPEYTPVTMSVGPARPMHRRTPLGAFTFHHIKAGFRFGYKKILLLPGQEAFTATPEKALLDLIHLTPGSDSEAWLRELRLNLDGTIDTALLSQYAERAHAPKLIRAAKIIGAMVRQEKGAYQKV